MNPKNEPARKRHPTSDARTAVKDGAAKPRIRVLIADDHGIVREGLASMMVALKNR